MTEALLRIKSLAFEGAGTYRTLGSPLPLGRQGRVLICGPEGCLDGDTYISYDVRDKKGRRLNGKGQSIRWLYHRFHRLPPPPGRGQYLSVRGYEGARFFVSSVNDDGRIFKNPILDVVKTGTKLCFEVRTASGHSIVATADHKFFVGDGYLPTEKLSVGSVVFIHNNTHYTNAGYNKHKRVGRPAVCVKHHPHGHVKNVVDAKTRKSYPYKRVQESHIAYEAAMNGLSFDAYRSRLNDGDLEGLKFLPPGVHVHHKDENFRNNDPENLVVMDPRAHNRQHALERHNDLRFIAVATEVVSINQVGERETFDLKVQGPHNNYVANGFVVHNSGKSMIPEVMTLVLYGKGSPRVRKSGLVESSIVNEAHGYQGTLAFDSGHGASTRHVSITQSFKHKRMGSRYIITVDGVRETPDTKPQQKKLVKRLAPLSYEEWLGVVYLHQGGIHDLLAGGPTEKREYLTSVFGLDFYDDLLTTAQEELKTLVKKSSTAGDLQQELANLEEEHRTHQATLDEVPGGVAAVEAGVAKLSERLQKLSNDLGKLEAADEAFDTLSELHEQIESLTAEQGVGKAPEDASEALETAQADQETCAAALSELEAQLRSMFHQKTAYDAAQARDQEAQAALTKNQQRIDVIATQLKDAAAPDDDVMGKLQALMQEAETLLGRDLKLEGVKVKVSKVSWQEHAKAADQAAATATKLEKLAKAHAADCPTCASPLDEETLTTTIAATRQHSKASRAAALSTLHSQFVTLSAKWWPCEDNTIGGVTDSVIDWRDVWAKLARLEETQTTNQETLTKAQTALKALTKPQSPEKLAAKKKALEPVLTKHKAAVKNLTALVSLHKQYASASKLVAGLSHDEVKAQITDGTAKREKTKTSLAQALKIKSACDQATASLRHLKKRISLVNDAIQDHVETAVKVQHYQETLVPFFTSLRASKVRACVSVLEGVLPVYVSAMSSNQYTGAQVKLSVSDDLKDVDLMLRTGEHTPWVSAVQASGGQRRRFTMAIIAALREVSPRKANLMFFDEPFADLESEGKLLFVQRLIPTLMERCPDLESVFVIAHDAEVLQSANDSFDSVWQVERDERGSRIELGKRLSMVDGR